MAHCHRRSRSGWLALVLLATAPWLASAADPEQAGRLDAELTPFGAQRAGNADGSIPAWQGGLTQAPACYGGLGARYCNPFAEDRPETLVTADRADAFEAWLSPGQRALLAQFPASQVMPVYATRRSYTNPAPVLQAIRRNAMRAQLQANGEVLADAEQGVPFPIPENGVEVIWNHKARYRPAGLRVQDHQFVVAPTGDFSQTVSRIDTLQPYAQAGQPGVPMLRYTLQVFTEPPRLDGTVLLIHDSRDALAQPRRAWQRSSGQPFLRKAPALAHDAIVPGSDGILTIDQIDGFSGPLERYDFRLLGRQELLVPANSYRLHSSALEYADLLGKHHLNPEHLRYERRRVWVVEAVLRAGVAHRYKRRRFYVDEDGWQIRVVDVYDARGTLIQMQELHSVMAYDLGYEFVVAHAVYDLEHQRYLVQSLNNQANEISLEALRAEDFEYGKVARRLDK